MTRITRVRKDLDRSSAAICFSRERAPSEFWRRLWTLAACGRAKERARARFSRRGSLSRPAQKGRGRERRLPRGRPLFVMFDVRREHDRKVEGEPCASLSLSRDARARRAEENALYALKMRRKKGSRGPLPGNREEPESDRARSREDVSLLAVSSYCSFEKSQGTRPLAERARYGKNARGFRHNRPFDKISPQTPR